MTPDDLATLLRWLYANDDGSGWLPAAAKDLRVNERNLRGMLAGKIHLPQAIADVVMLLVAAHTLLAGWDERTAMLPQLGLSLDVLRSVDRWRLTFTPDTKGQP